MAIYVDVFQDIQELTVKQVINKHIIIINNLFHTMFLFLICQNYLTACDENDLGNRVFFFIFALPISNDIILAFR